jgi:hypothetical protein
MEEELFNQMGLLLTQVRDARRALEDIESHTAAYAGLGFLQAVSREGAFGQPPMINGALSVYVVNVNDLSPGSGGGIIGEVLGGIGRFFGGLVGGAVGGFVAPVALVGQVDELRRIVEATDRIIDRLGLESAMALGGEQGNGEEEASSSGEGPGMLQQFNDAVPQILPLLHGLTAMFRAAAGGPGRGATPGQQAAIDTFHQALQPVLRVLQGINRIVDGLLLLVPMLAGAFASFLVRLNDVKLAVVEMMQFALRNVLLLRGVVLVTVFDTLSASANLGASILRILSTMIDRVLTAVFSSTLQIAETSMLLVRNLLDGLRNTVNTLLPWMLTTLNRILRFLGDSVAFRLLYHVVDILPNLLPALYEVLRGEALSDRATTMIEDVANRSIPRPNQRAGEPPEVTMPNIADTLLPSESVTEILGGIREMGEELRANARTAFQSAETALSQIAGTLDESAFRTELSDRLDQLHVQAQTLSSVLAPAVESLEERTQTGVEMVANAYESWLTSGGFDEMLNRITQHFQQTPTTGPSAARSIPGRVVADAALERSRATVEIENVVIEVQAPDVAPSSSSSPAPSPDAQSLIERVEEERQRLYDRGARPGDAGLAIA